MYAPIARTPKDQEGGRGRSNLPNSRCALRCLQLARANHDKKETSLATRRRRQFIRAPNDFPPFPSADPPDLSR